MRVYNTFLLTVALLLLLTTVILAALGQRQVGIYYTFYVIEALVTTELFMYFNAKARRGLGLVSVLLFGGFLLIVSLRIVAMLRR